jgi:hypothetical protein
MEVAHVKAWKSRAWFVTRAMLAVTAAVAVGLVLMGRDSRPASASHTEIFFSLSANNATATPSGTLLFYPNSAPQTIYVHAKGASHDVTGVSAFQVYFTYTDAMASVSSLQNSPAATTWLQSTGRSASCTTPIVEPNPGGPSGLYRALVGCYTQGATPPFGPGGNSGGATGSLLASFVLTPGSTPGSTTLTINNASAFLLNTTVDAAAYAMTKRNAPVVVAECGNFNGDATVSVGDIGLMVQHYGTSGGPPPSGNWDAIYDLNNDNSISVGDIGLVVLQFGRQCTP